MALFSKENIQFSIRKDLGSITNCLESLFIEINQKVLNSNENMLGVVYDRLIMK